MKKFGIPVRRDDVISLGYFPINAWRMPDGGLKLRLNSLAEWRSFMPRAITAVAQMMVVV